MEQILVTVARPNPIVVLWRWRYEVALLLAVAASLTALVRTAGATAAVALTAAVVLSLGIALRLSPGLWNVARARAACVITPHRIRTGCAQARIHSRQGRLPFVLLTRAVPDGERVLLWCRAGTSVEDFVSARAILTAACWASEVRVRQSPRHAQLVTLDVVRPRQPATPRPIERHPVPAVPIQAAPVPAEPIQAAPIPAATAPPRPSGNGQHGGSPAIPFPRAPAE